MAFCSRCGTQLNGEARFCSNCGNPTSGSISVPSAPASNHTPAYGSPITQTPAQSTWLCNQCGFRLNSTHLTCPVCGAANPGNPQVMSQFSQQMYQQNRATKSFSVGFSVVTLILGIILCLVHMVLLFMDPPIYLLWEVFVGAVSAAGAAVFSIIGMAKKEPVFNAVGICCGISVWMLFMYLFIAF